MEKMKKTIQDMQILAERKSGKCLSKQYVNSQTNLIWECNKGHTWKAVPNNVKRGTWCPYCAGQIKGTIQEMRDLAIIKGGKCLSKEYKNNQTKLEWTCSKGHKWFASPISVKIIKTWCPYCSPMPNKNKKLSIKNIKQLARNKNGFLLSKSYLSNREKLKWKCSKGHIWEATQSHIKSGTWCPYCAGQIVTLNEIKKIALERGYICLSNKYINANTKMIFKCKKNHVWEAISHNIKKGSGCPYCNEYIYENICRNILENIFQVKFNKIRPKWLVYEKRALELDGYNDKLKIAFEYNGIQHYKDNIFFHKKCSLAKIKLYDKFKKEKCSEKEIFLIEIPYTIKESNLYNFILNKLNERRFKF